MVFLSRRCAAHARQFPVTNITPHPSSVFIAPHPVLVRRCSWTLTCAPWQCTVHSWRDTRHRYFAWSWGFTPYRKKKSICSVSPYTNTWPYFALEHQLNCQVLSLTEENRSDLDSGGSHNLRNNLNPLTPNGHCSGRTALLTSRRCILNIYSTNIRTEYFKDAA
jgi:hypothetical protein